MSAPRTQRQEDAAAAAAARADADGLAAKREATRAASAAAAAAAARDADCAAARRRVVALAAAVRARSDASAAAWAELEPLLRERARSANVVAARGAAELLRELAPVVPAAPALPAPPVAPAVPLPALLPVDPSRPLRVASLFDGYGGFLIALLAALVGTSLRVEVVHAADKARGKVALATAVAAASGVPHAPPLAADVTDASTYTAAFCAAWGVLDILFAGFPCVFHSPEGRVAGARKTLRTPACKALVDGFFRVLGLATARVVIIECSPWLAADPFFRTDFLDRLEARFWAAHVVLDGSRWLPMNRERIYIVCFADHAAYAAFDGVAAPPRREVRLADALLPCGHALLPRGVYDAAKQQTSGVRSRAARAVAELPLLAGRGSSEIGVFKRGAFRALAKAKLSPKGAASGVRRAARRGVKRGVVPTLIKSSSGVLRLRDARGPRALCARECGALLGVPPRFIEAMLRVASDATVVSALGDGFAVPVVRDLLKKVLRVCGWGI